MKNRSVKMSSLPTATVERLCLVYGLCAESLNRQIDSLSSNGIGDQIGVEAHTVRKDINYVGEAGKSGSGYDLGMLKSVLGKRLGLESRHRTCVVGLGRLGGALLCCQELTAAGFPLVAGFDSSNNRLETIRTNVPLYPAYQMTDMVRREAIEIALLAVPATEAQRTAESLMSGGIKGIVNFAPIRVYTSGNQVVVRNINIVNELRIVTSLLALDEIDQAG